MRPLYHGRRQRQPIKRNLETLKISGGHLYASSVFMLAALAPLHDRSSVLPHPALQASAVGRMMGEALTVAPSVETRPGQTRRGPGQRRAEQTRAEQPSPSSHVKLSPRKSMRHLCSAVS